MGYIKTDGGGKCECKVGEKKWRNAEHSSPLQCKELPHAVADLRLSGRDESSLVLAWTPGASGDAPVRSTYVGVSSSEKNRPIVASGQHMEDNEVALKADASSHTLHGLEAGVPYLISVRRVSDLGTSTSVTLLMATCPPAFTGVAILKRGQRACARVHFPSMVISVNFLTAMVLGESARSATTTR